MTYVPLPAAVLAGLALGVDRGMEQGHVKLLRSIWDVAAVSPERLGTSAEVLGANGNDKLLWR